MDALIKATALVLVVAAVLAPFALDDSEAEAEMDGVMLYQVNPFDCEGVSIHNYGTSTVDISDYTIRDMPPGSNNEGVLSFAQGMKLAPGETLVIVTEVSEDEPFSQQDNIVVIGEGKVESSGRFALSNSGDDVYLMDGNRVVDAMFYGNVNVDNTYWDGPAVTEKDRWFYRAGSVDHDDRSDWYQYTKGSINDPFTPTLQYDAEVTPFLFPESGGIPIYEALESATESICIEMYQLGSKNVIALLCEKAADGVEVRVLLEGESLDGGNDPIVSAGPQWLQLLENGGEVRLIGVGDDYNRFQFDHAKFAVIDGDTTIVTSENWTTQNMNGNLDDDPYDSGTSGNRGWGAIVESAGYSEYMADVFENDWSMDYGDVKPLLDVYDNLNTGEVYYKTPSDTGDFPSYSAKATPVLSCDNSYNALMYYAGTAEERLYSEQQSFSDGFNDFDEDSPIMLFDEAAKRGVDTRVVFSDNVSAGMIDQINARTNVQTAMIDDLYVHNKGVICDDFVWVSSVNWTQTSMFQNRECCVVIESAEVADYFAESFLQDFDRYYTYGGFTAYFEDLEESYPSGEEIVFTVTVNPAAGDYEYVWDFGDGSATKTTEINRTPARPADGTHTLTVRITDTSSGITKTIAAEYTVGEIQETPSEPAGDGSSGDGESPLSDLLDGNLQYIIVILVVLLFAIAAAAKSRGGKSKKKGKRRNRWDSSRSAGPEGPMCRRCTASTPKTSTTTCRPTRSSSSCSSGPGGSSSRRPLPAGPPGRSAPSSWRTEPSRWPCWPSGDPSAAWGPVRPSWTA